MIRDILTRQEIANADYVIIAQSKSIDEKDRFDGKQIYSVEVAKPITKAAEVFDDMLEKLHEQIGKGGSHKGRFSTTVSDYDEPKQSLMSHMNDRNFIYDPLYCNGGYYIRTYYSIRI